MPKKYTILDIARLSGFSKSTVSKVLRDEPFVKESTRKKVSDIVKEVGYRPDELARRMVQGKNTIFIGLLISDIFNPVFSEIAVGVGNEANKQGYGVVLCNSPSAGLAKMHIEMLINYRAAGIISTITEMKDENIKYLSERNFPYVNINSKIKDIKSNEVFINHYEAAKSAVKYLIRKGHNNIAHFNQVSLGYGMKMRFKGYKDGLEDNKILFRDSLVLQDLNTREGGYNCARRLIESGLKASAIFASNDLMAIGAMDFFAANGYKVPDDISIIGFDDIWISSLENISLTSVHTPKAELGAAAVKILLERIEKGPDFIKQDHSFKTEIIERNSVKDIS